MIRNPNAIVNLARFMTPLQRTIATKALCVLVAECQHLSLDSSVDRDRLIQHLIEGLGLRPTCGKCNHDCYCTNSEER